MKPILVTGANGHVGNNLCRLLVARGHQFRHGYEYRHRHGSRYPGHGHGTAERQRGRE